MTTTILTGDCRDILPTLPSNSAQCVVTSPPYFGLRDYQTGTWEGGNPECDHDVRRWEGSKQTQGAQRVANRLGRHGVGIELNPTYVPMIERRTAQQSLEMVAS